MSTAIVNPTCCKGMNQCLCVGFRKKWMHFGSVFEILKALMIFLKVKFESKMTSRFLTLSDVFSAIVLPI